MKLVPIAGLLVNVLVVALGAFVVFMGNPLGMMALMFLVPIGFVQDNGRDDEGREPAQGMGFTQRLDE